MHTKTLLSFIFCGAVSASHASDITETLLTNLDKPADTSTTAGARRAYSAVIASSELNFVTALSKKSSLSEVASLTRGPKEASIFNDTVRGVVLVISEDGIGSGALITRTGHIVTNLHVVGNAKEVGIFFPPTDPSKKPSKEELIKGKVIKVNEVKDLALIQATTLPTSARPIVLANTPVSVGDDVHAIGHPKNQLWTYTKGYVSQLRPSYRWTGGPTGPKHEADVIQTQTPINPGNSGGPLVNDRRELVGINSFKDPDAAGLNYALHVSEIKNFLQQSGDIRAPKQAEKLCGSKPVYVRDGDNTVTGKHTAYGFDADCDGEIDGEIQIPYDKSKPHLFKIDSNGDGKTDIVVIDRDGDGKWDSSLLDTDFDGKFDHRGIHSDGKLIASRLEKIAG